EARSWKKGTGDGGSPRRPYHLACKRIRGHSLQAGYSPVSGTTVKLSCHRSPLASLLRVPCSCWVNGSTWAPSAREVNSWSVWPASVWLPCGAGVGVLLVVGAGASEPTGGVPTSAASWLASAELAVPVPSPITDPESAPCRRLGPMPPEESPPDKSPGPTGVSSGSLRLLLGATKRIEPNRPSAAPKEPAPVRLIPAVKYRAFGSPPLPPLPKTRAHSPSMAMGLPFASVRLPRNLPVSSS